ncbi:hypothetical protein Ancab_032045 [Ancistrocladus abbreviatus]
MDMTRSPSSSSVSQRLAIRGFPEQQPGLVAFVKNNRAQIQELATAILPTDAEITEELHGANTGPLKNFVNPTLKDLYCESLTWLQWLMFEGEPCGALENLANMSTGQRGVCGAVWGRDDIAYHCRTCEHDPTCAICVPCFQNGNHKDHDYSIIYTGSGCCDCGDETAWKREGFCSKHKGAEQIQPLPEDIAHSVGPVIDSLFDCWKDKLIVAETISKENPRVTDHAIELSEAANALSLAILDMLLDFCKHSESLLSFVSSRVINSANLLSILVRAEMFLSDPVTKKLHELLLKLLGEPVFKYELAKVFVIYYPFAVKEAIKNSTDSPKKYPLMSTFSVQIFTVPTLTPRLVKEMNLLTMLLDCLGDIFLACCGQDGRLEVKKWGNLFETSFRVTEDVKFVMSHSEVTEYVTHEQQEILRVWVRILSFVQGMNPQKREKGIHIEEENENTHLPFVLCHSIASINSLLVAGAFSVSAEKEKCQGTPSAYKDDKDDEIGQRHAKVGRLSQESSACTSAGQHGNLTTAVEGNVVSSDANEHILVPSSVSWLAVECLRAMDHWFEADNSFGVSNMFSAGDGGVSRSNLFSFRKALSKVRKGKKVSRLHDGSSLASKLWSSSDVSQQFSNDGFQTNPRSTGWGRQMLDTSDMELDDQDHLDSDSKMEESGTESEAFSVLSLSDWPRIRYDVSSQEISLHIPLHGLLSFVLKVALRKCYGDFTVLDIQGNCSTNLFPLAARNVFGQILKGCHQRGFSSFVMEHPLQIRVFCAQVHAGMWKKNGDAAILACEWYRSVLWSEHELELDLFLLQFCAALAPADLYVNRILERFGLSSYLDLHPEQSSEYEPALVQEMLTLIIQIVQERRFCGLTASENLQRELVFKLATGDATHSQLLKPLPRDLSSLDQLQEILDRIAQYSSPSGMNQGKYSLRLPYWKELDLYHLRWNPRDLQVAEERYSRFCGVSALTTQLPRWTKIYQPLSGIARIATCKVVLQVVRAVLFYSVFCDKYAHSRAPDGVLVTALHLISVALDICFVHRGSGYQSLYDGDLIPLLAFAGEEIEVRLWKDSSRQSLLSLLVLLMTAHKKENVGSFVEAGNFDLSSLVESLLKKFAELDSGCMSKLQEIAPEVVSYLCQSADCNTADTSVSVSDSEKHKAKAREKQAAVMAKMRAEQSKFLASLKVDADDGSDDSKFGKGLETDPGLKTDPGLETEEHAHDVCSLCHDPNSKYPVSFLVLLQKSRLVSFLDRGAPSWDQYSLSYSDKGKASLTTNRVRASTGRNHTATSTEMISSSQLLQIVQSAVDDIAFDLRHAEVDAFVDYLKLRIPELRKIRIPCKSGDTRIKLLQSFESLERDVFLSIQKHMGSGYSESDTSKNGKVFSAEERTAKRFDADSVMLGKYLAALTRETIEDSSASSNGVSNAESDRQISLYHGFGPTGCDGIHLSSCGHAVHQACLNRYLSSLKERYMRRIVFEGGHIVDPDQGEFLCPVCRRLANCTLSAAPRNCPKLLQQPRVSHTCSSYFTGSLGASNEEMISLRLQHAVSLIRNATSIVSKAEVFQAFPVQQNKRIRPNPEPVFEVLCGMYFPGKKDIFSRSGRVSPSLLLWDTLKHSLVSTEIAARSGRSELASTIGLSSLYKELKLSGGSILQSLLKNVESMRIDNSLDILMRFRGIQLFAATICSHVKSDESPGDILTREGKISCLLKQIDADELFPDTQFWNQASVPVLANDPFSTLMWILFCLPYPILSSRDCLLSLVHIFYAVSVTQAIITYCGNHDSNITELGFHDCLVTDIIKLVAESAVSRQYFVCNYIDRNSQIKDVVQSLSLPYLRRCALLWKLLNFSTSTPISGRAHVLDTCDVVDCMEISNVVEEVNEVSELENMFVIPPINAIVDDQVLRSLARGWFHHFCEVFECCNIQRVLHLTPAVPFQLMRLPILYQDILQRYIKPRCPDCKDILEAPALCLLCGRLCSPSWRPCCRESGCQAHAMTCGAGTGVFLMIKKTTILLQRNARQAPWPSPYLDAFGEEDREMHRGKPLYLNEERYAALTFMVASHGLDRSSKVLHQTTTAPFFMV